jgi:hypothetical protein
VNFGRRGPLAHRIGMLCRRFGGINKSGEGSNHSRGGPLLWSFVQFPQHLRYVLGEGEGVGMVLA